KAEIAGLSAQIGELRKEVKLCKDIETRSVEMRDKIHRAAEDKKSKGKERKQHEQFRGRR
ncbi:MAG: relaxase/mobilization nuclease, partial [Clostridiales bacterium]|nr:relaxase/mobilization nuclease [Clostridiales bacterium]